MLDQSFTTENFQKIYYEDLRKGRNRDRDFFPELAKINQNISNLKSKRKTALKGKKKPYSKSFTLHDIFSGGDFGL